MSIYSNNDNSKNLQSVLKVGFSKKSAGTVTDISRIAELIVKADYQSAYNKLVSNPVGVEANNTKAVLLMRLGRPAEAVNLLRPIVFDTANLVVKPNIPSSAIINFATALLMTGHVSSCLTILSSLEPTSDDKVSQPIQQIRGCIREWEKTLSWLKWLDWKFCRIEHVTGAFPLNYLPGVLDWERDRKTTVPPNTDSAPGTAQNHELAI